jgi:hypothetical protein
MILLRWTTPIEYSYHRRRVNSREIDCQETCCERLVSRLVSISFIHKPGQ